MRLSWGSIPGRVNSRCKGTEVEAHVTCPRPSTGTSWAGAEWARSRGVPALPRQALGTWGAAAMRGSWPREAPSLCLTPQFTQTFPPMTPGPSLDLLCSWAFIKVWCPQVCQLASVPSVDGAAACLSSVCLLPTAPSGELFCTGLPTWSPLTTDF